MYLDIVKTCRSDIRNEREIICKELYLRCPLPNYIVTCSHHYVFMFSNMDGDGDGDGGYKSIIERNLCCMAIRHDVFFIKKADMDHQRTRIVEDAWELEDF